MNKLYEIDREIFEAIEAEKKRQNEGIELIASENFVSEAVLEAAGSIMTNKYAEGYPDKRYYGGCHIVDIAEKLAIERAKKLFNVNYVNVQPHSGSQANMGVYKALLNIGDTVLGMKLDHGGHLTHGKNVNFSGKDYNIVSYSVSKEDERIDYNEVERIALETKPKMIIAGASAYSRIIDFKRFREIADKVGAYLMVDMAHIAGLIATGVHPSPVPYAHVVTTTTHKTLRGPRGGVIMTNDEEIAKKIDKTIFPGIQGGPLMHIIAAKAVAFKEALTPEFIEYQKQIVKNAQTLAKVLENGGLRIVSGGTDNHMMLIDVKSKGLTGAQVEKALDMAGITVNKNGIPYQDLFLSMIILIIILPIFAYLCLKISSLKDKSLYLFMIIYPNVGFIGFPLLQSLFGKQSLLLTALINMPFNLSLFTLGMMIMSNNKSFQIKKLITPGIIASLIAVLLYIFSISLPETLLQPIQLIGNMTTPLAMIIIGATLSKYPIKKILLDRKIYLFTIFFDLIIPMIFSPLVHFLIKDTMIQAMTMIILGMPVANGAVLFAKRYQQNEFLAAKTVFLSTLLSIITIPVVALCFI